MAGSQSRSVKPVWVTLCLSCRGGGAGGEAFSALG